MSGSEPAEREVLRLDGRMFHFRIASLAISTHTL
jgi:hypothetical protein